MTVSANADGLRQRYGLDTAKGAQVGSPSVMGVVQQMTANLEAGRSGSLTGGLIGQEANNAIPAGSYILRAWLVIHETFVGVSATLDLGLANADGTYTNLDEDGIDVAIAVASLVAGSVIACDGALVGAGTSRTTSVLGYLSTDADTAAFTDGKATLIVEYYTPQLKSLTAAD